MTTTGAGTLVTDRSQTPPGIIVLVGPLPPPSGGMANQTRQLGRLLASEGCAVRIVNTNAPYRPAWVGTIKGVRALFRLLPYLVELARATRGADVVHVMANSGWAWHLLAAPSIWIATLLRVPVIVNYRGGEAGDFFNRQIRLVRPTLDRARLIVVPSTFLQEVFTRHGVASTIVPNIVDVETFKPARSRTAIPHVLVTRNLEPIYDVGTALRAFALMAKRSDRAVMTVAGSGPERAALEGLAADLGISARVRFTGRIENSELPSHYRAASIALNPSLADNMPISLLEALASGVPIVSTHVGGVPHLVKHGETALLVPPRDPQAMAEALLRLVEDQNLAARLADEGLKVAAQYAWPRVRHRWFRVYQAASSRSASTVQTDRGRS